MKWSACLVCIIVWELPWYQCCVRFLVFPGKHQTVGALGREGRSVVWGVQRSVPEPLPPAFLIWLGELSRWKGLSLLRWVFPALQLQHRMILGCFSSPSCGYFFPPSMESPPASSSQDHGTCWHHMKHILLHSNALLRVKGGSERAAFASSPSAYTLQKQQFYLESVLRVWGRGF